MNNRCYEFIDGLKSLKYDQSIDYVEDGTFRGLGFSLHYDPTPGADLISDNFDSKFSHLHVHSQYSVSFDFIKLLLDHCLLSPYHTFQYIRIKTT